MKVLPMVIVLCLAWFVAGAGEPDAPRWEPGAGQTVVVLGNTFAERMALFGHFEAFTHARYPTHKLRVRNMGWAADTVDLQPRPFQFGSLDQKLGPPDPAFDPRKTWFNGLGADAIIACFGMTESFRGEAGLADFRKNIAAYLDHHLAQKYNGQSAPRVVLIGPIAHENLGPPWPDPTRHNKDLAQYVQAMREVSAEKKVPFVDLFTPHTLWIGEHPDRKLTFNGIHLTEEGDRIVSRWMAESLGWLDGLSPAGAGQKADQFRALVNKKNDRFHRHFRAVNGEYIYGRRVPVYLKAGPVPELPHLSDEEMRLLHEIDEAYDRKVHDAEKPTPAQVLGDHPGR